MIPLQPSRRGRPRAASRRSPHAAARGGFTVVEIIVAIMILSIGVLGLASTAAVVQRQMAMGERQAAAATIAQGRFDKLTSVNCKSLTGTDLNGTASWRGGQVTEHWLVVQGSNVKQITDTVKIVGRRNPLVYTTFIPCRN
ncbi:MAG: prepilin-type N-terminal cleavage/methylation domain-containing protein [Gemmatimonadaceae bacterium]